MVVKDQASVKAGGPRGVLHFHPSCAKPWLWERELATLIAEAGFLIVWPFNLTLCTQVVLDSLKFFGRPKLALDSVGGHSAARLVEALAEVRTECKAHEHECLPDLMDGFA